MKLLVAIQDDVYQSLKNNRGTAIENVMAIAAVIDGQILPDGCEILTKEAYADLCMRASKGNCSEIPTGSTAKIDVPDNNVGDIDCISRADVNQVIEDYMDEQYHVLSDRTRERAFGANAVMARINELPSVTPQEPKTGHWIKYARTYYEELKKRGLGVDEYTPYFTDDIACSECLAKYSTLDNETQFFKYCPNCGAKMEEVE